MEARELRIGNYIGWHSTDDIDDVKDISTFGIKHPIINNVCIEDVKPIPLTEEWLTKFGFIHDDGHFLMGVHNDIFSGCIQLDIMGSRDEWLFSVGCVELTMIKSVHQLQNLYFALTGEELQTVN